MIVDLLNNAAFIEVRVGPRGRPGPTGATGATGGTGQTGAPGTPGQDGQDGLSAYEIAVNNGFSGDEAAWLSSLQGDDGVPGVGVPIGGVSGQVLTKSGSDDYDTTWSDPPSASGGAGGVLSGTYPNPGFAVDMATQSELNAVANAKLDLAGGTLTGRLIQSTNGATSAPPVLLSGSFFTGGTSTTTKPHLLVEPTGTNSTTWSTAGTAIGVNAASGFTGNLLDLKTNNAARFEVAATGKVTMLAQSYPTPSISSTAALTSGFGFSGGTPTLVTVNQEAAAASFQAISGTNRPLFAATALLLTGFGSAPSGTGASGGVLLSMLNANELTLGFTHATTATNQTIKAHNVTTGTGADLILAGGTGSVASGSVRFGTHSAISTETITGYITIKDQAGNVRKIAVVS